MRIAHVTNVAARHGGAEAYLFALAEAQRDRGHEIAVAHAHGAGDELANGVASIPATVDALEGWSPDVVHVHGLPLDPQTTARVHERFAVVRSLHDFSFGCASGQRWFRDGSRCDRAHGLGCLAGIGLQGCSHRRDLRAPLAAFGRVRRNLLELRRAHAVVVHSRYMRHVAVKNGIPAEHCVAIPYFVEQTSVQPAPPSRRDVAFAGRVTSAKGLDVLLLALAAIPDRWDRLRVAGEGWDRARCERVARDLDLADRVDWLGWQDAAAVRETITAAAVTVLPSRWPEPFGIVGVEAMARGRPVVASDTGGIGEWLVDGETGYLVPPGDAEALASALARIANDPAHAAVLGRAGWERARQFAPAAHIAQLETVYAGAAA